MTVLITGIAGFIGHAVARHFLNTANARVIGIDNLNAYYSPILKRDRLDELHSHPRADLLRFYEADITNIQKLSEIITREKIEGIIHLAAQAGVRHSLHHPHEYIDANICGFLNLLEICRHHPVRHLVYASSSSVYGNNSRMPFSVEDRTDTPLSFYAVTKKTNELMAHTYQHLFGIPTTGLRYFTVYGPWGRPDMAPMLFAKAIIGEQPIRLHNHGQMSRDFTYIEDIAHLTVAVYLKENRGPQIFNIGRGFPIPLTDFIRHLEQALGKKALLDLRPMPAGEVPDTWADTTALRTYIQDEPRTDIQQGISRFAEWFLRYPSRHVL